MSVDQPLRVVSWNIGQTGLRTALASARGGLPALLHSLNAGMRCSGGHGSRPRARGEDDCACCAWNGPAAACALIRRRPAPPRASSSCRCCRPPVQMSSAFRRPRSGGRSWNVRRRWRKAGGWRPAAAPHKRPPQRRTAQHAAMQGLILQPQPGHQDGLLGRGHLCARTSQHARAGRGRLHWRTGHGQG